MERTRIVHYTHSRTPVILSPTSPNPPRLSSSSSMSSLVSGIDEKAPLASIDVDFPSTPRRSSKSSDQNGTRSSSTGRLLDDSKLGTSVYTALRCQDLPIPSGETVDIRSDTVNGDVRKERSRSDVAQSSNGNSPNTSMDDAMRRHTLGSWSRSRRKPQSENSNGASSPRNSTTLSRTVSDAAASDTLVKSRRRYTWLSSKQTVPQGPTVARPQKLDNLSNNVSLPTKYSASDYSSTFPRPRPAIKSPLSPLRQQNGINGHHHPIEDTAPNDIAILAGTSKANGSFDEQHNCSIDSNSEVHRFSLTNDKYCSPKTSSRNCRSSQLNTSYDDPSSIRDSSVGFGISPTSNNPHTDHGGDSDGVTTNNKSSSSPSCSPKTDPKPGSPNNYNWRRDPRRRPCHFVDAFNLSPPQSPPEPAPGTRDPPSMGFSKNGVTSIVNHSPLSSKKQQNGLTRSPSTKRQETSFSSRISTMFGSERCNSKTSQSSESSSNSYVSYAGPDNDLTYDDKTPVNELEPLPISQFLSDNNSNQNDVLTSGSTDQNFKYDNTCRSFEPRPLSTKQNNVCSDDKNVGYRDCLVRDPILYSSNRTDVLNQSADYDNGHFFKSGQGKNSLSKRSNSVAVCSGRTASSSDKSIENILKSPRTRNSFKIAVGSNWDDVFPAAESLSKLPNISEDKALSPKRDIRKQTFSEEDVFISCDDLIEDKVKDGEGNVISDCIINELSTSHANKLSLNHSTMIQEGGDYDDYDSLNRRIKRNSMRLATASLSDLTCAIDDINLSIDNSFDNSCPVSESVNQNGDVDKMKISSKGSPLHLKSNLSRTGSLLSSQNGSNIGSYYSCQSNGTNSNKNSPSLNAAHRKEMRSRLDSPLVNRLHNNYDNKLDTSFPSSTRTSSPVSVASSGRSGHRQKPAYYWTRQAPYPRLLYARSSSVASSRGSGGYRTSSPQPSTTSSIHTNNNHKISNNTSNGINRKSTPHTDDDHIDPKQHTYPQRPVDSSSRPSRSMTLPISNPYYKPSDNYYTPYTPDLSPSSVLESPNSNAVRSPPSLGRPKRKQYAGFDCQPLPMDSFMSDSSSVYTGVSCSSRATDMTGQPDNGQFDESFMSEEIRSCFGDDSRGDISFDASETLQPSSLLSDITISKDLEENESKRGSIHSTSTTKQENGDISVEEKSREDINTYDNISDDFIESSNEHIAVRHEKQFGSEYDALFRLYKTDDVFKTPSYSLYSQNGKAFSSSCLLRAQLYSKRKFLSTRDIFDLIRDTDKTHLDGTVSLTSLERHADKVCEAILCCEEMDQGYMNNETHSLV